MLLKQIILGKGRETSVLRGHPWLFSGAVADVQGEPASGETVEVRASNMSWLGRAEYSPLSQIRARIWTTDPNEPVDEAFFERRIASAVEYRKRLGLYPEHSCRLIHGEADGLPAVVVDKYGDFLSCEFLSAGAQYCKGVIVSQLAKLPGVKGIYERSEAEAIRREGLEPVCGTLWGEEIPDDFTIEENGLQMRVNIPGGHKTGFYLDQRENRLAVQPFASGADVLDCCCYSGAFGLQCLRSGAKSVLFLDGAAEAIELARSNAAVNGYADDQRLTFVKDDMFTRLRRFRDSRQSFDLIVLDPPKFASTKAQLLKAAHGYKDINLLAAKLLRPNGVLMTFSCSAAMTPEFFRTVVGEALTDAHRTARIIRTFAQAPDHPQATHFPEGHYLTGLQLMMTN